MAGVLFPDVEEVLIDAITDVLTGRTEAYVDGAWVGNKLPDPRPSRAILVRDDGGPHLDTVRAIARVGINVFAPTSSDATDLGNLVAALTGGLANTGPIRAVTISSRPYRIEDESGQARTYFTAELVVRGTTDF